MIISLKPGMRGERRSDAEMEGRIRRQLISEARMSLAGIQISWRGGGSNLASFGQLQGQAAGFEVGASGDPGFGIVNFIAEKSGVPNQASKQLLKQWRIRIGI